MSDEITIEQEDDWYVITDHETGVTTQGKTKTEAIENLAEAIELNKEAQADQRLIPDSDAPWLDMVNDMDSVEVGDITLHIGRGHVVVYRDEERIGEITAQGLHEAADLGDERLSESWAREQKNDQEDGRRELTTALTLGGMDDFHVISEETARQVLTDRRREIIQALKQDVPNSVQDLAQQLGRDKDSVSRDLDELAENGIITYFENESEKRPVLTHERIIVEPLL